MVLAEACHRFDSRRSVSCSPERERKWRSTPLHRPTTTRLSERTTRAGVADGDTIVTTTVDSRGSDSTGEQVAPRGNPQTGPFFVEGAAPGDTLAVTLDRLEPNRALGYSGTVIAPNVVDPWYVERLPERQGAEWRIDLEARTATLISPETNLGQLVLSLAPMLGCFGVAPDGGEAISTATSAEHGGNMDYRGFCEGVTAYFPVLVDGALLHLGDGHALQGDGEILGNGIEISKDVQVTYCLEGRKSEGRRGPGTPSHRRKHGLSTMRPACDDGDARVDDADYVSTAAARAALVSGAQDLGNVSTGLHEVSGWRSGICEAVVKTAIATSSQLRRSHSPGPRSR